MIRAVSLLEYTLVICDQLKNNEKIGTFVITSMNTSHALWAVVMYFLRIA